MLLRQFTHWRPENMFLAESLLGGEDIDKKHTNRDRGKK